MKYRGRGEERDCITKIYWEVVPNLPMPVLSKADRDALKPPHNLEREGKQRALLSGLKALLWGVTVWMPGMARQVSESVRIVGRVDSEQYLAFLKGTAAPQSLQLLSHRYANLCDGI